jgi:hypothetical protein
MRFARRPQQEFLLLPSTASSDRRRVLLRRRILNRRILLPVFEDAHSVQSVIRQVMQMVLQKRIERKTASLLLYALQIASSNLKRMELEKPQPEQVVIDVVTPLKWEPPIAAPELTEEEARETAEEASAPAQPDNVQADNAQPIINRSREQEELPPGTIQACHRPRQCESSSTETETSARKHAQGARRETSYKLKPTAKAFVSRTERSAPGQARGAIKWDCGTGIWQRLWIQTDSIQLEGIGGATRCGRCSSYSADHASGVSLVLSHQRSHRTRHRRWPHALAPTASDRGAGRGDETSAWALEFNSRVDSKVSSKVLSKLYSRNFIAPNLFFRAACHAQPKH